MKPNCQNCAYWSDWGYRDHNGSRAGDCRRYPPQLFEIVGEVEAIVEHARLGVHAVHLPKIHAHWPGTAGYAWCGEHKLKPDPEPEAEPDSEVAP